MKYAIQCLFQIGQLNMLRWALNQLISYHHELNMGLFHLDLCQYTEIFYVHHQQDPVPKMTIIT